MAKGLIPLSMEALKEAIRLNGAGIEGNLKAFDLGRWSVLGTKIISEMDQEEGQNSADGTDVHQVIMDRKVRLKDYQNSTLARKYETLVLKALAIDENFGLAVAKGYYKLLAFKDEYEVARLHIAC